MLAPLSRRGSRVRTAYTCLSCLRHGDSRRPRLLIDQSARTLNAPFSAASSSLQNAKLGSHDEAAAAPGSEDPTGGKSGEAPEKLSSRATNDSVGRRRRSRRNPPQFRISNSRDALDALRASLIAEDNLLAAKKKVKSGNVVRSAREKKETKTTPISKLREITAEGSNNASKTSKNLVENTVGENGGNVSSKLVKKNKKSKKAVPPNGLESLPDTRVISTQPSELEAPKLVAKKKKKKLTSESVETAKSEHLKKSKGAKSKGSNSKTGEKISKSAPIETIETGTSLKIHKVPVSPSDEKYAKATALVRQMSLGPAGQVRNAAPNRKYLRAQEALVHGISHYAQRSATMVRSLRALVLAGVLSKEDMAPAFAALQGTLVRRLDGGTSKTPAAKDLKDSLQHKRFERIPSRTVKPSARHRGGPTDSKEEHDDSKLAGPVKAIRGTVAQEIKSIDSSSLALNPLEKGPLQVPSLSYGLERVLFNPGVYELQDPRSRTFNFDHYLQTIMPVSEFDFNALKEYITSSRDVTLLAAARAEKKKYTGSTSSMTAALAHFHFLLSQWRPVNTGTLSKDFPVPYSSFTALQRGPVAIFLRWRDGTYAIDADKQYDTANILSMLGKSMEKLLTLPKEGFERYRKPNSDQISEEERNEDEAFHYTTMGDFLLRSQLDAHDPKLPGTGMFDLKTRAVVSIRMDASQYEEGRGYEILGRHGEYESYEREYYDMIRAAFLKYSLQVRMGRMDGIFVAFHNTERIFGFQYISISEMDYALHGTSDVTIGDSEFKLSLDLLNRVLDRATAKYPEKSLRLHFETRKADPAFMYIFAEPVEEEEIEEIQATNKAEIAEFESKVLGLVKDEDSGDQKAEWDDLRAKVEETMEQDEMGSEAVEAEDEDGDESDEADEVDDEDGDEEDEDGDEIDDGDEIEENEEDLDEGEDEAEDSEVSSLDADDVERTSDKMEQPESSHLFEKESQSEGGEIGEGGNDTTGDETLEATLSRVQTIEAGEEHEVPATVEGYEAPESEGMEKSSRSEETEPTEPTALPSNDQQELSNEVDSEDPIFGMTLTIRNKVNGAYVDRPNSLNKHDKWVVEYALAEVPDNDRARALYNATKTRRSNVLSKSRSNKTSSAWNETYIKNLKKLSQKGRKWRQLRDEEEKHMPIKTLNIEDHKLAGYNTKSNSQEAGGADKMD